MANTSIRRVPTRTAGRINYEINGNRLSFEKATGALLSLSRKGCPEFLAGKCGLIDVAWPVTIDYDPLRLSPSFIHGGSAPRFKLENGVLIIKHRAMPQNIATPEDMPETKGGVEATIYLSPDADGRSISMRAVVKNKSKSNVEQVLFPSLDGLAAVSGEDEARFTTSLFHHNPYKDQASTEKTRDGFFGSLKSIDGQFYRPGGFCTDDGTYHFMGFRWMDFGNFKAGLSLYRRHWGFGPENLRNMGGNDFYWTKVNHTDNTLRLASIQFKTLGKDDEYDSGEYVLTPHKGSWIQGIGAFKGWLKQHQKRIVPSPPAFREMFGFRTAWFGTGYPNDPDDTVWTYHDMPRLAEDAKEHGLTAISTWGAFAESLPISEKDFYESYGGFDLWCENVKRCREMGVEISPLISHVQVWYRDALKRGLEINMSWAQTIKSIPVACADYMRRSKSHGMHDLNVEWWLNDSMESLRFLRDKALCPAIMWDQYILIKGNFALEKLINDYRLETEKFYPGTMFYGESTNFCESDISNCDSHWNWVWWEPKVETDFRPYLYCVETSRPNLNIDSNPLFVKYAFMDNVMINAYPSKPDSINGSALISDYPEFGAALKNCAALRKKYIEFIADGTTLGDCPLTKNCNSARLGFYEHEGKMLGIAVLGEDKRSAVISYDFTPYLDGEITKVIIKNELGELITEAPASKSGKITVKGKPTDLFTLEFVK